MGAADPMGAAERATFDVLGVGVAAVDDILWVEAYPPPDSKVRVVRRERHPGGLTATALVAAARLGWAERALEYYHQILPLTRADVERAAVEPYV